MRGCASTMEADVAHDRFWLCVRGDGTEEVLFALTIGGVRVRVMKGQGERTFQRKDAWRFCRTCSSHTGGGGTSLA